MFAIEPDSPQHNSKKFVLFLVGNVIEKYINNNNDCGDHDSSYLFCARCSRVHYFKLSQPPLESRKYHLHFTEAEPKTPRR